MKKIIPLIFTMILFSSCELVTDNWQNNKNGPVKSSVLLVENMNTTILNNENQQQSLVLFESKTFHFSLLHPDCRIKEDTYGVNILCGSENITIARQPNIPGISLPDSLIENITISGIRTKLYHDQDAQTGVSKDIVLFHIPGSRDDFYLSGYGPIFTAMLQTVVVKE